ncbi:hypothetical protein H8693_06435 [Christensenellaceae bacterium NSJ-63]|uniref:Uncharacterized protein n=1 Tax=Guopingia tenuis TaxID=2763656 RepID=A0A926DGY4_9FIRM|nr:hypothetical protein [Guopingia tenuis]MBC8538568.1 hypothetical protein [Guopingia tenuis]MBS5644317.1 hypothetical protein [Clostridiales bacterium]
MNIRSELQALRAEIIQNIDAAFDRFLCRLEEQEPELAEVPSPGPQEEIPYESIFKLSSNPAIFKGTKPTGVCFADGRRINAGTWKMVYKAILEDCNKDVEKHVELMNLRGKILGKTRVLLSQDGASMTSPIQLDRNLFVESHYDTEMLLRILMTRILDPVRYDYSQITVAIRNDR